ncbi:MAG: DMT family transporter [Anaerolineae bacterium]|jgi:drug/metabolite transporter (DMT)-like permease
MAREPSEHSSLTGIALVNLATFTWATNMVLGRWLRGDIGPLTMATIRFIIASAIFAILLQRRPAEERRLGSDRWLLLAMAISGVAIFAPLLYLGLRYTTVVNSTLINGFGPLITGLLATLLIGEPMNRRQIGGALAGMGGIAILLFGNPTAVSGSVHLNVGDLVVVGAVALWGLYSVLGRCVMKRRSALSATAFSAFMGLPFLSLAAIWEVQHIQVHLGPGVLLALLYIGIFPTVIGFLSWNAGVRRLGASGAMVFYNTLPLYGALLGIVFLHEPLGLYHLVGGSLIAGGGVWAARSR